MINRKIKKITDNTYKKAITKIRIKNWIMRISNIN